MLLRHSQTIIFAAHLLISPPSANYYFRNPPSGFAGALICAAAGNGDNDNDMNEDHRALLIDREMTGNILAFLASVSAAFYLTVAKRLRPNVDLVLFMFLIFTVSSLFLLVYIMAFSGQEYEFSFDPVIGLFGWINRQSDRLPLEIYIAVICNGVGTMGYIGESSISRLRIVVLFCVASSLTALFVHRDQ